MEFFPSIKLQNSYEDKKSHTIQKVLSSKKLKYQFWVNDLFKVGVSPALPDRAKLQ